LANLESLALLYSKTHEKILRIAEAGTVGVDVTAQLQSIVDGFRQAVAKLDPKVARHARNELCMQIEHEMLAATDPNQRTLLLTALKGLEAIEC
jgi:hypothetical protein